MVSVITNTKRYNVPETSEEVAEAGVALVDLAFQTVAMDQGAAWIVSAASEDGQQKQEDTRGLTSLPPSIRALIAVVDPASGCPAEMRFRAGNESYQVRASLMAPFGPASQGPCYVVQFQRQVKTVDPLGELSIKFRLTDREREALSGIAIGLTSKEVAQRMNIAPSTVKAFLRLIMIKTGAPNRAGIVARLVAPSNSEESRPVKRREAKRESAPPLRHFTAGEPG